jgi:hypothetical protein
VRKQRKEEDKAATKIQAKWKGNRVRKQKKEEEQAATKI